MGHNLLSTISLAKKRVEVLFRPVQVPSEIRHEEELFGVVDIITISYLFGQKAISPIAVYVKKLSI